MPILSRETDIFPDRLLDDSAASNPDAAWWVAYTSARREKQLMRHLHQRSISFYCPIIPKRNCSPQGRIRTSYVPLFAGYVFIYGTEDHRQLALKSNCISRFITVNDSIQLRSDLLQVRRLIADGVPLTVESRIEPGQLVRIRTGAFKGFEGIVLKRHSQSRLVVSVRFIEQGVSIMLDDCQFEPI